MHSLAPYSLRCFNPGLPGKNEDKYARLDKIGSYDTFELLKTFISSNKKDFKIIDKSKQVYRFSEVAFDDNKRVIQGWFELGHYGVKTDIINVKTGKVDFEKTQENAEIIKHFVYFYIPTDVNEAIALLHLYRGNGIKTVFYELFKTFFNVTTKFNLQMNPLSYEKAFKEWEDASAKEIKLVRFNALNDIADDVKKLGHDEQTLLFKPPRRKALGKFKDFLRKGTEQNQVIEMLAPLCAQVKTVVELNGRKRTFTIGANAANSICEIEAPEDLELEYGNPKYEAIKKWCSEVASEYSDSLYKSKRRAS